MACKEIDNFPGYRVYPNGTIETCKIKNKITDKWNYVKQYKTKCGYMNVVLCSNSKHKNFLVHRLVAISFIENTKLAKQVNHKDGNKQNNCVENLEWVSCKENINHARKMGLYSSRLGENSPNPKLKYNQVEEIRILIGKGFRNIEIAKMFNISPTSVRDIKTGRSWARVDNI